MADCYVGEIRLFAGLYPPANWHFCDGTLLSTATYAALFAILGTTYGGDGRATFGLPDLRGRIPIGQGAGPDLTPRVSGQSGGQEAVALQTAHTGAHSHSLQTAGVTAGTTTFGSAATFANTTSPTTMYLKDGLGTGGGAAINPPPSTISTQGMGVAHDNMMPTATLTYMIALVGIFPARS